MKSKIISLPELKDLCTRLQRNHKRIVWTNGCYDILHAGHVLYLQKAKETGDVLIVGLNSDESIRAVKGPTRPIVSQGERAIVMAALECVDYVIIFPETSPYSIIETLQPDVYAKGGDYTLDTINQQERRLVEGYGGEIALLPGVAGSSTTAVINKILQTHRPT